MGPLLPPWLLSFCVHKTQMMLFQFYLCNISATFVKHPSDKRTRMALDFWLIWGEQRWSTQRFNTSAHSSEFKRTFGRWKKSLWILTEQSFLPLLPVLWAGGKASQITNFISESVLILWANTIKKKRITQIYQKSTQVTRYLNVLHFLYFLIKTLLKKLGIFIPYWRLKDNSSLFFLKRENDPFRKSEKVFFHTFCRRNRLTQM